MSPVGPKFGAVPLMEWVRASRPARVDCSRHGERWALEEGATTTSGRSLFRCATCGRLSPTPDRTCFPLLGDLELVPDELQDTEAVLGMTSRAVLDAAGAAIRAGQPFTRAHAHLAVVDAGLDDLGESGRVVEAAGLEA